MLGTDFPFSEFLPGDNVKKVQIDKNAKHIGRRTAVDLALVGDIKTTITALLPKVSDKRDGTFLERHVAETKSFHELLQHYVDKGPEIKPIRPEFLAATLSELAADDAMFFADTGTACIWVARHIKGGTNRRIFGSFSWASMANAAPNAFGAQLAYPGRQMIARVRRRRIHDARPRRPADPSAAQDAGGSYYPEQRIARLRQYRDAGSRHRPVRRRFQEPEFRQSCRGDGREGHPHRRTGRRERRARRRRSRTRAAQWSWMRSSIPTRCRYRRTSRSTWPRASP